MIATSLARWSLLDEEAVISMKKQSERNSAGQAAINPQSSRQRALHHNARLGSATSL